MMNIDTATPKLNTQTNTAAVKQKITASASFKQELNNLSSEKSEPLKETKEPVKEQPEAEASGEENIDEALDGLQNAVEEINKAKQEDVPQEEEITSDELKKDDISSDRFNKKEDSGLINNDMNIQEPKEQIMPQMDSGMNFNSSGQPFSAFVKQDNSQQLESSEKDLQEESAILSTMAENLAMLNKNSINTETKSVSNTDGIKEVDTKSNITVDTVVKFDTVVMTKNDVDFFANLVQNGIVNMDSVQSAEKSAKVSQTLADLLAKSMNENKPVRINFDNDISVIIRISKDGKISADFLPNSQIAEAYLKENLPLLRQKFDDNNIEYDELNHRQQKQDDKDNKKKGRKDE